MRRRDLLRMPPRTAADPLPEGGYVGPRAAPGSSPGTLPEGAASAPPLVYAMAFGPHEVTEFAVDDLEQLVKLRGRWPVLWVNVDGVRHAPALRRIGEIFDMHRLAVEDVTEVGQPATAEVFDQHLMVIAKMVRRCPALDVEQVSLFCGRDYVVSFQERPGDSLEPVRERIRRGTGRIRRSGPDYLTYALLDAMVDHCFPVVEHYLEGLDELEHEVLHDPNPGVMVRLHATRRDLLALRRAVYPMREALRSLVRDPPEGLVRPETVVYLRDVQDNAMQVVDLVESCRDLGASLTDLYLSFVGNRTNDIMKVLTVFAAIFIPLGFITGFYGMNVDAAPEWMRDLRVAEASMLAVALALLVFFWRRGWIRGSG